MSRYNRDYDNNGRYYQLQDNYYDRSAPSKGSSYRYRDQYNQGYDNYANTGQNNVNKPKPAATKQPKQPMYNKNGEKIKSVLFNPKVREQLANQKKHKPYFIYTVSAIQLIIFLVTLGLNYTGTGNIIAPFNENFMVGPSSGTLIKLGARYLPCMKKVKFDNECPLGIKGSIPFQSLPSYKMEKSGTLLKSPYYCSLSDICGFGGLFTNEKSANQWFRFFTPIFTHSGAAHLIINLLFQIRAGKSLEKDYGSWRILVIYFTSGVFGFMFEAQSGGYAPVVGCSSALYGLLACILLDLIQNWKLIVHPWKDLTILVLSIVISFGFGLLPFIDNLAHIGGFIMGILTGLIFLPSIIFSNKDEKIKSGLRIVAIFISTFLFVIVARRFYATTTSECKWCKYLNCAPFLSTCSF